MGKRSLLSKKKLLEIFVHYRVDSPFPGDWESIFQGAGYEFWSLRELESTDSPRYIDWKTTAKTGRYYVREYLAESYFDLMLIYDASKSVAFGRKDTLQANIAISLAYSATMSNNGCGLIIFADDIITVIPPKMGWAHFTQIVAEIVQTEPTRCHSTRLDRALTELVNIVPKSLTFVLSDFLYPFHCPYSFHQTQHGINKHEVKALQIVEEWELELPPNSTGVISIYDYESEMRCLLDLGKWKIFNEKMKQNNEETKDLLQKAGIDMLTLTPADDFVNEINRFMRSTSS